MPISHVDNLHYNKEQNSFFCPMGQRMEFIGHKNELTEAGYNRLISSYQAHNCNRCPVHGACHKSKDKRIIEVSHRLNELKAMVRERLLSEKGIMHRKKRPVDVEPVFGILKQNKGFRRFLLKGLDKVGIEFGLLALAYNLKKPAKTVNCGSFFADLRRFLNPKSSSGHNLFATT